MDLTLTSPVVGNMEPVCKEFTVHIVNRLETKNSWCASCSAGTVGPPENARIPDQIWHCAEWAVKGGTLRAQQSKTCGTAIATSLAELKKKTESTHTQVSVIGRLFRAPNTRESKH